MNERVDILVVGAGLAGLTAASALSDDGTSVLVVDKSRGVGGRMATRRIGGATFDHGAQFITVRDESFARSIEAWREEGIVAQWFGGTSPVAGHERVVGGGSVGKGAPAATAHARYRGNPSMTAVAKALARTLDVRLGSRVKHLAVAGDEWSAHLEDGTRISAGALLLTPPVPQSLELLDAAGTIIPSRVREDLHAISYEMCIAVMSVLDGPSTVGEPGGFAPADGPVAWIADNQRKGISDVPAVTLHADGAFSEAHWEEEREEVGRRLIDAAAPWLGSGVTEFQVHGWRYSKPVRLSNRRCLGTRPVLRSGQPGTTAPPVVFAGDAFGGPRVEGAFLSGRAAADHLKREIGK